LPYGKPFFNSNPEIYMFKISKAIGLVLVVSSFLLACNDTPKDAHPLQLVSKRQAIFKQLTKTLEPMGLVVRDHKAYDPQEFKANALSLQHLSSQPWALFTSEGNYPPTRAKPEVWSKATEFKLAQDSYMAAVEALVKAAATGELPVLRTRVEELQKSCKDCHNRFRNEMAGG
jgi:cytochrome c556